MISKLKQNVLIAFDKGYRVKENKVISSHNKILKLYNEHGYFKFNINYNKKSHTVYVHKLLAYQKYGIEILNNNLEIRHLDGDSLNNNNNNIILGTHSNNMLDINKKKRIKNAITASNYVRKFTDTQVNEIKNLRNNGYTYKEIGEIFNVGKSTLSYLFNNIYVTTI